MPINPTPTSPILTIAAFPSVSRCRVQDVAPLHRLLSLPVSPLFPYSWRRTGVVAADFFSGFQCVPLKFDRNRFSWEGILPARHPDLKDKSGRDTDVGVKGGLHALRHPKAAESLQKRRARGVSHGEPPLRVLARSTAFQEFS